MTINVHGHVNLGIQRAALDHLDDAPCELNLSPTLLPSAAPTDRVLVDAVT